MLKRVLHARHCSLTVLTDGMLDYRSSALPIRSPAAFQILKRLFSHTRHLAAQIFLRLRTLGGWTYRLIKRI